MKSTDGILWRLPLKGANAAIDLIDIGGIFISKPRGTALDNIA